MKRTFYTMLLATALVMPASYASAQIGALVSGNSSLSNNRSSQNDGPTSSIGAGVNGTMGVDGTHNNSTRRTTNSTADNNSNSTTGAGTSATMNSGTNDTTRLNYSNDSSVRSNRDRNAISNNSSVDTRTNAGAGIISNQAAALSSSSLDATSVRSIQQSLNDRGYNVGNVDGRWGASTAAQLRKFERSQGLTASTDGALNAQSLNQLGVNVGVDAGANVNRINPSSGSRINTPAMRSGVSGSTSYNQ